MNISDVKKGQRLFDSRSGGGFFKVLFVSDDESSSPYVIGLYTDGCIDEVRDLDILELTFVSEVGE